MRGQIKKILLKRIYRLNQSFLKYSIREYNMIISVFFRETTVINGTYMTHSYGFKSIFSVQIRSSYRNLYHCRILINNPFRESVGHGCDRGFGDPDPAQHRQLPDGQAEAGRPHPAALRVRRLLPPQQPGWCSITN